MDIANEIIMPFRRTWRWLPLIIVTCSVGMYFPTLYNFFVSEDLFQVNTNASNVLSQFFPNGVAGYRPVMYVWWFLGSQMWGYHAFAYHWFSVLLHGVNGLLVYVIARTVARRSLAGVIAVALYLPMPIHADAINWLSAASNQVTCGFFYLTAVWLYLRQTRLSRPPRRLRWGTLAFVLLALATNEVALTLPLTLMGFEWFTQSRGKQATTLGSRLRIAGQRLLPILGVWVTFVAFRTLAVHGIGGYGDVVHLRAGDLLYATGAQHLKMLLSPFSNIPGFSLAIDQLFSVPWQVFAFLSVLVILLWPGRAGLVLFAAAILPILNIPAYHRLYISSSGMALAVGLSAASLVAAFGTRWVRVLTGSLAVVMTLVVSWAELQTLNTRNHAWIHAAQITAYVPKRTHELYPALPQGTVLYYYGLPLNLDGAQVFNWGLRQSLQMAYGDTSLKAYRVRGVADLTRDLERTPEMIEQNVLTETNQLFFSFDLQQLTLEPLRRDSFLSLVRRNEIAPK